MQMRVDGTRCYFEGYTETYNTTNFYKSNILYYLCLCQEAGALHSSYHKVDLPHLLKRGMSWVVLFTNIKVERYLTWPEKWNICTYIVPQKNNLTSRRIIECTDEGGNRVFWAESLWSIVRVDKSGNKSIIDSTEVLKPFGYDMAKELPPFERLKANIITNPELKFVHSSTSLDKDANSHSNNISYLKWVLDALPTDKIDIEKITNVSISYKHEIKVPCDFPICLNIENDAYKHIIDADIANGSAFIKITQKI